jgi:hypothetical protein
MSTTTRRNCTLTKQGLPSFKPIIFNISPNTSVSGAYSLVYITGMNFFPNGTTYINFGPITNIPITYYGSFNISFVVPVNISPGTYDVNAVNIYNGNFSTPVQYTYSANLNYSDPVPYTLT